MDWPAAAVYGLWLLAVVAAWVGIGQEQTVTKQVSSASAQVKGYNCGDSISQRHLLIGQGGDHPLRTLHLMNFRPTYRGRAAAAEPPGRQPSRAGNPAGPTHCRGRASRAPPHV